MAALGEYIHHFNVHYNILLRRYQRFVEIDEPLNNDIDISTYFDMIIVQLRAMCIESPKLKNNYTAQILLRKIEGYIYSENYLRFWIKSVIILLYIYGELGIYILFTLEIMKGEFDYGKRKFNNHFRLKHRDVFSAC